MIFSLFSCFLCVNQNFLLLRFILLVSNLLILFTSCLVVTTDSKNILYLTLHSLIQLFYFIFHFFGNTRPQETSTSFTIFYHISWRFKIHKTLCCFGNRYSINIHLYLPLYVPFLGALIPSRRTPFSAGKFFCQNNFTQYFFCYRLASDNLSQFWFF